MAHFAAFFWLRSGQWLDAKGLAAIADTCYRHSRLAGGRFADEAAVLLGKRLLAKNSFAEAISFYQGVLRLNPGNPRAWCGLGAAQRQSGKLDDARGSYERALEIDPDYPHALTNMGEWWLVKGEPKKALEYFDRVLQRDPRFYEALANRVVALFESDRVEDAEQAAREAIEFYPDSAPLHVNLGNVLLHTGRGRPGLLEYRKALELQPENEEAAYNLALLQGNVEALHNATAFVRRQIELKGETTNRLLMLATAQKAGNQLTEAEETCREVLAKHPDHIFANALLAACAGARGDSAYAIECYEKALKIRPEMAAVYSNVLLETTHLAGLQPEEVFRRHRLWAERYEQPLVEKRYRHAPAVDTGRRLRIGYVSGDFCSHPVGMLFRDVIRHHDRSRFEIHCYSAYMVADTVTEDIRGSAEVWHDIALMADGDVAELIHADGIDILIDLSGHTAFNKLQAFAQKPAPVQATWIGYFHSTGLDSIDYFITDPHGSPAGSRQLFSEVPVHLPHSRFCYAPSDYVPEVAPPPVLANGYVTFGSFNRLSKLSDTVVEAWAAILKSVPDSRLMIKTRALEDPRIAEPLLKRFAVHGIPAADIVLRPGSGHYQMFVEYGEIDIALDSFPFNGGMTTLDALWMGVPVVSVAGDSVVSRQSLSALANIGLAELAFPDIPAFVRGAAELAADRPRLVELRQQLRPRMAASPLRQPEQFTRDLEQLYGRMWQAWCDGKRLPSAVSPPA
jgi:protein O-GlcNAc transferase